MQPYATICTKYAQNMQNQICINMHFQNIHKFVLYMHKYAILLEYAIMQKEKHAMICKFKNA